MCLWLCTERGTITHAFARRTNISSWQLGNKYNQEPSTQAEYPKVYTFHKKKQAGLSVRQIQIKNAGFFSPQAQLNKHLFSSIAFLNPNHYFPWLLGKKEIKLEIVTKYDLLTK